eukprot:scaffold12204_cov61-Phaeocystis_antarctica.AAC.8
MWCSPLVSRSSPVSAKATSMPSALQRVPGELQPGPGRPSTYSLRTLTRCQDTPLLPPRQMSASCRFAHGSRADAGGGVFRKSKCRFGWSLSTMPQSDWHARVLTSTGRSSMPPTHGLVETNELRRDLPLICRPPLALSSRRAWLTWLSRFITSSASSSSAKVVITSSSSSASSSSSS